MDYIISFSIFRPIILLLIQHSIVDAQRVHGPGSIRLVHGVIVLLLGLLLGIVTGILIQRSSATIADRHLKPRYPRDWHKLRDLFTRDPQDPRKPGYLRIEPEAALETGHTPLGRTLPRWSLFPDCYPFQELRRRIQFATSRPVALPYKKRFTHLEILGGTGKGKSTTYILPVLAFGALEKNTSYYAIDVKAPEMTRALSGLYKRSGKPLYYLDPWSLDESLACEPLWRAHEERKNLLADIISSYQAEGGSLQPTENSAFFREKAGSLLRALLDLSQYWPRRYTNLPCVQQLVASGSQAICEAFRKGAALLPSQDDVVNAATMVLLASAEDLTVPQRSSHLTDALGILDRAGYPTVRAVRRLRRYRASQSTESGAQQQAMPEEFVIQLRQECESRRQHYSALLMTQGEFLGMQEETRSGIVATLANKTSWFRHSRIARVFSRDELDVDIITRKPCLVLIGAPMGKLKVGSLFVSSLLSNLALSAVYQRGMAMGRGEAVSQHGIFFTLDEFAQLQIRDAPNMAAIFRGFLAGMTLVLQERSMLRHLYNELAIQLEGCLTHKVLFQGAHEDTAKFYATENLGEARIVKRTKSGIPGERQTVTESVEMMPRMSSTELRDMVINGKRHNNVAMSVGSDAPAFPLLLVPYDQEPTLRKLLGLTRTVTKDGKDGKRTWRFWEWRERWSLPQQVPPVLTRNGCKTATERAAGIPDPVYDRLNDPYRQIVDYILYDPKRPAVYDQLMAPSLVLAHIGVTDADPANPVSAGQTVATAPAASNTAERIQPGATPSAKSSLPAMPSPVPSDVSPMSMLSGTQSGPIAMLVPTYEADFRALLAADYHVQFVAETQIIGGTLPERVAAMRSAMQSGVSSVASLGVLTGVSTSGLEQQATDLHWFESIETRLLTYDPYVSVGTIESPPEGGRLRYVDAETYYPALLAEHMDANKVFISAALPSRVPAEQLAAVDDAIVRAYWDQYLGCLFPRRVIYALLRAASAPNGDSLVQMLERTRRDLFAAAAIDVAVQIHGSNRAGLLVAGAMNVLTERQVTVGEILTDYLFVQRAIADDVRRAEERRHAGETRAVWLDRFDRDDQLQFYYALSVVQRLQHVVEQIPEHYRDAVEAFANRRIRPTGPSVFAEVADDMGQERGEGER